MQCMNEEKQAEEIHGLFSVKLIGAKNSLGFFIATLISLMSFLHDAAQMGNSNSLHVLTSHIKLVGLISGKYA